MTLATVRKFWSLAIADASIQRQVIDIAPVEGGNYARTWLITLDGPPLALTGRRLPARSSTSAATVNRVMERCQSAGVPSPVPVWARGSPGRGVQSQLLTWIEGSTTPPEPAVEVTGLADAVTRIAMVDSRGLNLPDFPRLPSPRWQDRICRHTVGRAALDRLLALPPPSPVGGLVHGDLCQANLLWRDERLVGVIDWDRAGRGPLSVDIAMVWTDLVMRHGLEIAEAFMQRLASEDIQCTDLVYWQLRMVASSLGGDVSVDAAARLANGFEHLV